MIQFICTHVHVWKGRTMKRLLAAMLILMLMLPLAANAISADDFVVSDDLDVNDTDKYYFYARLLMSEMTLEEKAAQLFIVAPEQLAAEADKTCVSDDMANALRVQAVGGVMIGGENIVSEGQLTDLIGDMQKAATDGNGIPLLIVAEEEGGYVERIAMKLGLEGTPSLEEIAALGYEEDAWFQGQVLVNRLKDYGFNMNLAPVADLRNNTDGFGRFAGKDAENTAAIVSSIVQGMQQEGVIAAAKHFPGETGEATIGTSYTQMKNESLLPFERIIENGARAIVVSGKRALALDAEVPAMFSDTVCEKMLREELGFEGVIVTHFLNDAEITSAFGSKEAALNAIHAGCDMLLMPADYAAAHQAVVEAVQNGEVSQQRLEQSVVRILAMKIMAGLID